MVMRDFGILWLLLAAIAGPSAALAQPVGRGIDKESDGRFTGLLLVTDDVDWHDMFQQREPPSFAAKDHFAPGEEGALAIIFSNADPEGGQVRVMCDITARDAAGARQLATDQVCYEGPFFGPNILHPALLDLRFGVGEDDPVGEAGFDVTLRDGRSGREVSLSVSFTQGPAQ